MEATALREQGWSISAIARHLGRDWATVRKHLDGDRVAGVRRRSEPDVFEVFVPYLRERLREDPPPRLDTQEDEESSNGEDHDQDPGISRPWSPRRPLFPV